MKKNALDKDVKKQVSDNKFQKNVKIKKNKIKKELKNRKCN